MLNWQHTSYKSLPKQRAISYASRRMSPVSSSSNLKELEENSPSTPTSLLTGKDRERKQTIINTSVIPDCTDCCLSISEKENENSNGCDSTKKISFWLAIIAIFAVAYYFIFCAVSSTYKRNKTIIMEPEDQNNIIEKNGVLTDELSNSNNNEEIVRKTQQALERKKRRRRQRRAKQEQIKKAKYKAKYGAKLKSYMNDCCDIDGGPQQFEFLPQFPSLYISDSPYYMDENLVIMGQLNNAEMHLNIILNQLESVACLFKSTSFILFESNSNDKTVDILNEWNDRPLNCSKFAFNPQSKTMYEHMSTLDDLTNYFEHNQTAENDENEYFVDDIMYSILSRSNYSSLDDVDCREIEVELSAQIKESNDSIKDIEIEQIVFDKLMPVKYVKYQQQIQNHIASEIIIHKFLYFGDEMVENELKIEQEILQQLKIYDGVNEFHTNEYMESLNALKSGTKLSDFQREFGQINSQITNGLISKDQRLKIQQLRSQIAASQKESAKIAKKFKKFKHRQNEHKDDEYYTKYRDKLYRIERFSVYRNFLLNKAYEKSVELDINYDYVMIVDMDIYNMDVRTFMNELYYASNYDVNGLCVNGMDWLGHTRDTFATVDADGGWLHYGHNPLVNESEYIYNNDHAMNERTFVPNEELHRFENVKSCFGGIIAYKNEQNLFFDSQCKYTLTRDVFWTDYNNSIHSNLTNGNEFAFNYTYDYWLEHRHHNEYSEESMSELQLFRDEYVEILQIESNRIKDRSKFPHDGDICEHIPFHYCLIDHGLKLAISSRAKLYYDELYPIRRRQNDDKWTKYFENRPKFTL